MTAPELLSRLSRVKKQRGDQEWAASCPAHGSGDGDKNPSLSIKAADGKILLNCFAGCGLDAILSALNLTAADLFDKPDNRSEKRTIVKEYPYHDEDGKLLFQAIRFAPKHFSQRRPDGSGGWIWNLQGVRRVVYRLSELLGQKAIVIVEGEKDADAAWALQIPATCNPMGAGKWDPAYAQQLQQQGVQRVAIIPDNDAPGVAHATTVAASLQKIGIEVRIIPLPNVPDHGDLSDYLAGGGTKADLLALIKNAPIAATLPPSDPITSRPEKDFQILSEQRYGFTLHSHGIYLELDRIRRSSHELWGELSVKVNGHFPEARTFDQGILQVGDLNLSSVAARQTRAKLLAERSADKDTDWYGLIEEFAVRVLSNERSGAPDVDLRDVARPTPDRMWRCDGVELPIRHPTVLFGDGGSAKSYLALYWAGKMVEDGIQVLYCDWEWTQEEHRERLELLFGPAFPRVRHLQVYRSLRDERERIARTIQARGIQFLIFDSVALACGGDPSGSEACTTYWQFVRQFGIGSLHIAHVTKGFNGKADDQKPFGSAFWHNMARVTYNIKGEPSRDGSGIDVGIFGRKSQWGRKPAHGFKITFGSTRTVITAIDVQSVPEISEGLPLRDRILSVLAEEPITRRELAETLSADLATIQRLVTREIQKGRIIELPGKKGQQRLKVVAETPANDNGNDNASDNTVDF